MSLPSQPPPPPYETLASHHHQMHNHHKVHGHSSHHGHTSHPSHHSHHSHHAQHHLPQHHLPQRHAGCRCIGVCTCNRQPLSHFPQPPLLHYHTFPTIPVHHHQIHVTHAPPIVTSTVLVRRSRSILCSLFVFLMIFFVFFSIMMSLPHVDNWLQRQNRIRRRHEQGVAWSTPVPGPCLRTATRGYSATLQRYRLDQYWKEACETTEVYIHGRPVLPTRCELSDFVFEIVIGHWEIDFDEPKCTSFWTSPVDEGCSGPGERHFSARIMNVDNPDQWEHVCSTTPLDIQGTSLPPTECTSKGLFGMWGHWKVPDEGCSAF